MRKIAIAAANLVIMIAAGSAYGAECGLKLIASYDISRDVAGAIVIPLKMAGGTEPVLVDTGAFGNWVTKSFVDEHKLELRAIRQDMKAYTVGSRITKYVTIPSVDIGPVHVKNTDFTVWPDVQGAMIAGALGINALQQFDIEFDFAANKMNFFSQDHCDGQVVYWAKSYTVVPFKMAAEDIQLTMTLDGHDFNTKLDTGSTYSYVNSRVALGVFGYDENSPNVKDVTLPGGKARAATFNSLSIGGIAFPKPSLLIHEDTIRSLAKDDVPVKDQNQAGVTLMHFPHLVLGLDALKQLHLYIAFKEHKIYATAANAH